MYVSVKIKLFIYLFLFIRFIFFGRLEAHEQTPTEIQHGKNKKPNTFTSFLLI